MLGLPMRGARASQGGVVGATGAAARACGAVRGSSRGDALPERQVQHQLPLEGLQAVPAEPVARQLLDGARRAAKQRHVHHSLHPLTDPPLDPQLAEVDVHVAERLTERVAAKLLFEHL